VTYEKLQPLGMRVMDNQSNRMFHVEEEISNGVREIIEQSGLFSEQQITIVKSIIFDNDLGLGLKNISGNTGLNPEAVKTQVLRIRNKVNELMNSKFQNSIEAVLYLRQQGLV